METKSLCIFLVLILTFSEKGFACFSTFKNAQNISYIQQDCTKSAGLQSMPSAEELSSENMNDKCLSKCILNGFQMLDNDGQIDKDVLLDFMEMNAPDAYLLKLGELATSCIESSGSDKIDNGSKTGKSAGECKPMQDFFSCFLLGAEKLC